MKRFTKFAALITSLAGCFSLWSCSNDDVTNNEIPSEETVSSLEIGTRGLSAIKSVNSLSISLLNQIEETSEADANTSLSPASVLQLIGAMSNGADAQGQGTILEYLNLSGDPEQSMAELNALCKELSSKLSKLDRNVTFSSTNTLWVNPGINVKPEFLNIYEDCFAGSVVKESPAGSQGMRKINKFVSEKTNGLIPNLLNIPLSDATVSALLNTVYFKGSWADPFDKGNTSRASFHNASGSTSNVQFMKASGLFSVADYNGFTILCLPFGNKKFSMSFILDTDPQHNRSISSDDWIILSNGLHMEEADIRVPKFDVEGRVDDLLELLPGMREVNYSGILDNGSLLIPQIVHASRVTISEEGCEAAGSSIGAMFGSSGEVTTPRAINFDHPFTFVISEKTSGAILFIGKINGF